jgi:large subunit ribosomal protein L23
VKSFEQIIISPLVTEKNTREKLTHSRYVFKVLPTAEKIEIRRAVEKLFNVKVRRVNTSYMPGKLRGRIRGSVGHTKGYKKAFVTLMPGSKIEFIENMM